MTEKEKYKKRTDQAWDNLYARLDNEGLLTGKVSGPSARSIALKWSIAAAAVAILCVVLSVVYRIGTEEITEHTLLTQQNKEVTTSLVTTLEDGSVVYLAGNTSLHYPEHFPADKREVSLQGNALFDITGNRTRPFLIETEDVQIEVLGTAFNVKSDDKVPFELSVQRGEVKVTLKKSGQVVHVKAGETASLQSKALHLSETKDFGQFARYTEHIRFKDEKLGNILRVINLQTPDIRLQTVPALEGRTLTVTFSENTPEMMAELICLALNVQCTKENDTITISE